MKQTKNPNQKRTTDENLAIIRHAEELAQIRCIHDITQELRDIQIALKVISKMYLKAISANMPKVNGENADGSTFSKG